MCGDRCSDLHLLVAYFVQKRIICIVSIQTISALILALSTQSGPSLGSIYSPLLYSNRSYTNLMECRPSWNVNIRSKTLPKFNVLTFHMSSGHCFMKACLYHFHDIILKKLNIFSLHPSRPSFCRFRPSIALRYRWHPHSSAHVDWFFDNAFHMLWQDHRQRHPALQLI